MTTSVGPAKCKLALDDLANAASSLHAGLMHMKVGDIFQLHGTWQINGEEVKEFYMLT